MKNAIKTDILKDPRNVDLMETFAFGNRLIDMDGRFGAGLGMEPRTLKAVHLTTDPSVLTHGIARPARMSAVGTERLPEDSYIFFEDTGGEVWPYQDCREWCPSVSRTGVFFDDAQGTAWFAGYEPRERDGRGLDAAPLVQVSRHSSPLVAETTGPIDRNLPFEGEVTLTGEELPRVAFVHRWSSFGSDADASRPDQDAVMSRLRGRADAIRADHGVLPDPDPNLFPAGRTLGLALPDWQPEELRAEDAPASVDLKIRVSGSELQIETPDGRALVVELENGDLRVRGYNGASESPANMRVATDAPIDVDDADHRSNSYRDLDPAP